MNVELKLIDNNQYKACGCSKCVQINPQPLSNFGKNKAMKGGLANYCKTCQRKAGKKWDTNNKPARAKNRAKRRKERKIENPEREWAIRRNYRLKEAYGITLEHYLLMLANQNDRCAICNRHASEFPKKLVVDHDHKTGTVRKLLCGLCNQLLGSAKENIQTLREAISYLEVHSGY